MRTGVVDPNMAAAAAGSGGVAQGGTGEPGTTHIANPNSVRAQAAAANGGGGSGGMMVSGGGGGGNANGGGGKLEDGTSNSRADDGGDMKETGQRRSIISSIR